MKYISVIFMVSFFIVITIVGLRDCEKPVTGHTHFHHEPVEEPYVMANDIIFEVYMGESYGEVD